MKKSKKKILFIGFLFFSIISFLSLYISNEIVNFNTATRVYNSTESIPKNRVGLLLGTSKYTSYGNNNLYYQYRIEGAVKLFKSGKIEYILVSGDNSSKEYDEPTDIKNDLITAGIPENRIFLDYAGFRTLDSVIRSKEIFNQDSITIISQRFHNQRAIFIAKMKDIDAVGFNAQDLYGPISKRNQLREKFARVKMMIDLIFDKKAKFLGEKIEIE